MIKYADRGLVENGIIRKLFGHLYYLASLAWFAVALGIKW